MLGKRILPGTRQIRTVVSDEVLSEANKENFIKKIKRLGVVDVSRTPSKKKTASVLVPLCHNDGKLSILFIVRSLFVKINRGHAAFPGGIREDQDKNLEITAIRETQEEIGLDPSVINIWCSGPPIARQDVTLTPVFAYIGQIRTNQLTINPAEVASVFCLSLDHLCSPQHFQYTHFRSETGRGSYKLPIFVGGPVRIWGVTAFITQMFLQALLSQNYKNKIDTLLTSKPLPRSIER